MENIIFQISGTYDGKPFATEMYQGGENEYFTLRWQEDEGRIHIRLIPKFGNGFDTGSSQGMFVVDSVCLISEWSCKKNGYETIFMNGYQSWTDSEEKLPSEREKTISKLGKAVTNKYFLDRYGDYHFTQQAESAGQFHGFTYCYFRHGTRYHFLGSLSERQGFTVFYYNANAQQMRVEKECAGLEITGEWDVFDLLELEGREDAVFDAYFQKMEIEPPKGKPMTGYTSWYNHYQNISEEILMDNLKAAKETKQKWDVFQIDDGYQNYVGDWLTLNEDKFPNGFQPLVDQIHDQGMLAGLWLAPFACEKKSELYQKHPDWLILDENGEPYCCGSNWSTFYALNLEMEPVKEYLRKVFDMVLNQWNFDLVKLDFLYAACILPTRNKSRGQLMCEAMDFLRELIGDKKILGCGVPLGPAFGKVDYCRIGCDVGLDWNGTFKERFIHRERISTRNAIGNTIYRRQLNGRAFWNDPDVYLLRDDNMKMNRSQKSTLARINGLFGGVLFTSDNVKAYDEEKQALCDEIKELHEVPKKVKREKKHTIVEYEYQGEKHTIQI